ncbi:MAG TPA: ABC transporter ATP-binding protein [Candidatus Saccharibacteria bacterium]|jgi:putative ABC transport system ATP-binding protein|nr:ABC transporter ATP-binding protein [Candidatus Saccharibacteria bacterium]HMT55689.1 ABC transporter ATP-binding protein [Candidatus Saccharibacteria bacterium]
MQKQAELPKKTQDSTTMARVVDAYKIYGKNDTEVRALNGVTIDFQKGVFTAIMGPSGSGKSTLLHCAAGLDKLSQGTAEIAGHNLGKLKDKSLTMLRRKRVGFIFQSFNLVPTLTAKENILLPLSIAGRKADKKWFKDLVTLLGIADRLNHTPTELSGGQIQRVAVARALVSRPDIIFADEPSGNLDSKSAAGLLQFLRKAANEYGQAIVMVTHDPNAAAYADRVVMLKDGNIVDEIKNPSVDTILEHFKKLGS